MQNFGMHFGCHRHNHVWLNSLSKEEQEKDIERGLSYLEEIGVNINPWTMCYLYGGYNEETLKILKQKGCKLAFTTNVKITNRLEIPRLDTNDIPENRNSNEYISI